MKIKLDKDYIYFEKINLNRFLMTTTSSNVVLHYNELDASIEAIVINNTYTVKIGDEFKLDNCDYVVNVIRRMGNAFHLIEEQLTKTSQFILPMLGKDYQYYDFNDSFYNSYISEDYEYIYLRYVFKTTEEYLNLEEKLQKHPLFQELIDPNSNTVVFKFKIPELYYNDTKKIMRGNYSDISSELKSRVCLFHGFNVKSRTFRVLYKEATLREELSKEFDMEIPEGIDLISKPILKHEIWELQNISKKL